MRPVYGPSFHRTVSSSAESLYLALAVGSLRQRLSASVTAAITSAVVTTQCKGDNSSETGLSLSSLPNNTMDRRAAANIVQTCMRECIDDAFDHDRLRERTIAATHLQPLIGLNDHVAGLTSHRIETRGVSGAPNRTHLVVGGGYGTLAFLTIIILTVIAAYFYWLIRRRSILAAYREYQKKAAMHQRAQIAVFEQKLREESEGQA